MQAASGLEPTFSYPGDQQCAITYRDDGNGTMSWTATVTVAGRLRTMRRTRAATSTHTTCRSVWVRTR